MIELINKSHTLVFGCGNPLFGDDGFGPAVIQYLETHYTPADGCTFIDVGTSIREILFDIILSDRRPEKIIILDAVDMPGRWPGELFDIDVDQIRPEKISDFSLHQFPTTNMLKELKENTSIDIRLMVVQFETLPDMVAPGLSLPVQKAVPVIAEKLIRDLGGKPIHEKGRSMDDNVSVTFAF
ncbi:MAG: hydrogenase maturation protease [Proteobacteria bacterium]|nr:hydrogenase maturation protease [Pseudomonadota bacterium]